MTPAQTMVYLTPIDKTSNAGPQTVRFDSIAEAEAYKAQRQRAKVAP